MIKNFNNFINEKVYYNSHGVYSTFSEIRALEVDERENYSHEDFDKWQEKYNIKDSDLCIWVTGNKKQAYSYILPAEYYDDVMGMSDWKIKRLLNKEGLDDEIVEINDKDGFIIPESDDSEDGFLFIKK